MWSKMNSIVLIVFCSVFSVLSSDAGSGTSVNRDTRLRIYRQRRQSECDGFVCRTSRECINEDSYCDGKSDCRDGSDETENCKKLGCPNHVFRCDYGACISSFLACDGKKDCRDGSDETPPKCKRNISNSTCKATQFMCDSGQCISEDNVCDGTPDCYDKSDETKKTCAKVRCPEYSFKCEYGACVAQGSECDGTSQCADGSDENPTLCASVTTNDKVNPVTPSSPPIGPTSSTKPASLPGSCVLPQKGDNGNWSIAGVSSNAFNYQPGDKVNPGTILQAGCKTGYKIDKGNTILFCAQGKWSGNLPECVRTCPPLKSTETTFVQCTHSSGAPVDCAEAISYTTARFTCTAFYELPAANSILFCFDGTWDEMKPTCKPVCGEKNVKIKELSIGGTIVKRGTYPWTIALYKKKGNMFSHVCGGSLINQRVIVTAAHCVANKEGVPYDKSIFRVAAGKYYRIYDDPKDTDAEFSEVHRIEVPKEYKGSTFQYAGDIAIIVTKERFNQSQFIQRVCVDWDQRSAYEGALLGTNGIVTGWGYTIRGANPSPVLKEISLPFIPYDQCYSDIPDDYKQYVRSDKMCAGFLDKGLGVCEGDSGGGLVFPSRVGGRFFLRGVVSVAPQVGGSCNENEYSIYTKISSYITMITTTERAFRS